MRIPLLLIAAYFAYRGSQFLADYKAKQRQTCTSGTCPWESPDADILLAQHRSLHVKRLVNDKANSIGGLQEQHVIEVTRRMELLFELQPDMTSGQADLALSSLIQELEQFGTLGEAAPRPQAERGHKPGLNLAIQNAAVLRFRELELQWIAGLPEDSVLRSVGYVYGEVGFVLAGVKPCALYKHMEDPTYATHMAALLQTMIEELKLESHGFQLHTISHPLVTSDPSHPGLQGAVVFANHRHADFEQRVLKELLTPQRKAVREIRIGLSLGYPTRQGDARVLYVTGPGCTEEEEDATNNINCIKLLEYSLDGQQEAIYPAVMKHYQAYRRAFARQLGQVLGIDLRHTPRLQLWWLSDAAKDLRAAEQSF